MSLQNFAYVSKLRDNLVGGREYARITQGPNKGSVGAIQEHEQKHYSRHMYRLQVEGRRAFWISGDKLEHLPGYSGETLWVTDAQIPAKRDFLDRDISVGSTLLFQTVASEGKPSETVLGTVRHISPTRGALWVQPIKIGSRVQDSNEAQLVQLVRADRSVIIDQDTIDSIVLLKLMS